MFGFRTNIIRKNTAVTSTQIDHNSYINTKSLLHELRGLLTPFATGLHCLKSGNHADGLVLQEEVFKKLKVIVEQLNSLPREINHHDFE